MISKRRVITTVFLLVNQSDPFFKIEKVHADLCNGVVARSVHKKETAQKIADQFNEMVQNLNEMQAGEQLSVKSLFAQA